MGRKRIYDIPDLAGRLFDLMVAASTALILGEGKRKNGRWERNTITRNSGLQGKTELDELRRAGRIEEGLGVVPGTLFERMKSNDAGQPSGTNGRAA